MKFITYAQSATLIEKANKIQRAINISNDEVFIKDAEAKVLAIREELASKIMVIK